MVCDLLEYSVKTVGKLVAAAAGNSPQQNNRSWCHGYRNKVVPHGALSKARSGGMTSICARYDVGMIGQASDGVRSSMSESFHFFLSLGPQRRRSSQSVRLLTLALSVSLPNHAECNCKCQLLLNNLDFTVLRSSSNAWRSRSKLRHVYHCHVWRRCCHLVVPPGPTVSHQTPREKTTASTHDYDFETFCSH